MPELRTFFLGETHSFDIRFRLAAARKPRPGTFHVRMKGEAKEEIKQSHNHDPDAPNALVLYRAPKFEKFVNAINAS